MTKKEFSKWLKTHCALFDGVRRFVVDDTLDEWERVLASVPFDLACAASRRLYDSEFRPPISDHAVMVKRAATDIAKARRAESTKAVDTRGDMEGRLRDRHAERWAALSDQDRRRWIDKALREIKVDGLTPKHQQSWKFVVQYAETLHAESIDPNGLIEIQDAGWATKSTIEAGATPPGGF